MNHFFSLAESMGHESVVFCNDPVSGLKAIIGIHDTTLGPALGGTRLWSYDNEADALKDVMRLSRGMTYKAACAGLHLGGGKAVIIARPEQKTEAMFRAFGRFVNSLGGRYITAEDVNTGVVDMDFVRAETPYVTGVSKAYGGSGDPSPVTSLGVFCGLEAAVKLRLGRTDLKGVRVAVQGIGNVGKYLCQYLSEAGAKLVVSDINANRAQEMVKLYGATQVENDAIFTADVDVFAPCALGAILNSTTIPLLKATVIAGGANNQLEDEVKHGNMVKDRKIAYCPDYVINAGGLINVYNELLGYDREKALSEAKNIGKTIQSILADATKQDITSNEASRIFAENRIKNAKNLKAMSTLQDSALGKLRSTRMS